MTTISLKLPEALMRRVDQEAAARRITKSSLIREALVQALERSAANESGSCHALARDLAGSIAGLPRDLATNPRYLEGFGQ